MNVIEEIIKNKKMILKKSKEEKSLVKIKKEAIDYVSTNEDTFRFQEKLKSDATQLIAEFKPASPSQGDISALGVDEVISLYDKNNVDMISVLTEESYFKSNLNNFIKAGAITNKPLLRKDFVIDEYMIYEAALYGASCVLLIANLCPDMEKYLNICENLGLDAIVECHDLDDINSVIDLNPKIIGVNNRNLKDLTVNLDTTKELREYVPNYMISESGVKTADDAQLLKSYGADAVLIGTSILQNKEDDEIGKYIDELSMRLKQ